MNQSGRSQRWASRLPSWMGSVRIRIALLYSLILFGLAALLLLAIYLVLAWQLSNQPVITQYVQTHPDVLEQLAAAAVSRRRELDETRNAVLNVPQERLSLLKKMRKFFRLE